MVRGAPTWLAKYRVPSPSKADSALPVTPVFAAVIQVLLALLKYLSVVPSSPHSAVHAEGTAWAQPAPSSKKAAPSSLSAKVMRANRAKGRGIEFRDDRAAPFFRRCNHRDLTSEGNSSDTNCCVIAASAARLEADVAGPQRPVTELAKLSRSTQGRSPGCPLRARSGPSAVRH
jgi:hypothetical protein